MNKTNPIPAKNTHFLHDLEYIIYIKKKGAYFDSSLDVREYHKFFTTQCRSDNLHPSQKPLELIKRYIKILSKEGDLVLDCFMGSGTTAVACKQLKRNFIGFEKEQKYVDIVNQRLEQNTLFNY